MVGLQGDGEGGRWSVSRWACRVMVMVRVRVRVRVRVMVMVRVRVRVRVRLDLQGDGAVVVADHRGIPERVLPAPIRVRVRVRESPNVSCQHRLGC